MFSVDKTTGIFGKETGPTGKKINNKYVTASLPRVETLKTVLLSM
jgi:hypothetical protein